MGILGRCKICDCPNGVKRQRGEMDSEETIIVRINNFEKFNPRKDVKRNSWVRFEIDFFDDPNFYDLTNEEKLTWIYILCYVAKKYSGSSTGDIHISRPHFAKNVTAEIEVLYRTLNKLKQKGILTVRTLRGRYANVSLRTNVTNERDVTIRTNVTNEGSKSSKTSTAEILPEIPAPPKKKAAPNPLNTKIWEAYSAAIFSRYKREAPRNATVNGQIANLGKRLGEDAVEVVKFFVESNNSFYARKLHQIGLCLADAESLHLQWQGGRAITEADVKNLERKTKMQTLIDSIDEEGI